MFNQVITIASNSFNPGEILLQKTQKSFSFLDVREYYGIQKIIRARRKAKKVYSRYIKITTGDILSIQYRLNAYMNTFQGICFSMTLKKMPLLINSCLKLRNIITGIGVEVSVCYVFNRAYKGLDRLDFKRKSIRYRRAKLYFIRYKKNKASFVK